MHAHCNLSILTVAMVAMAAGASPANSQTGTPSDALTPYMTCSFPDGLQIVRTDPLAPGITRRDVETDSGSQHVEMEAGMRIMFAYPDTDFYANVKAEVLPVAKFGEMKAYLMENFEHLAHGNTVNTGLKSPVSGFEAHGLDRDKLEGGVLGIYLLFDQPTHTVMTIYMLNQEPQDRKFKNMDEYRLMRDRFLATYTACVRDNQKKLK
jgi:hypothetical protein